VTVISVLVCTRNRPESLLRTVRSLLRPDGESFELLVIDQSDATEGQQALADFAADRRMRYVRSRAKGKGAALNEGLRLAKGAVVVCTDDDCEAPAGWVTAMAAVMDAHPTAAVVFCNVLAAPYDRMAGYVPAYERHSDRLLSSVVEVRGGLGLGAGMALRRQAVLEFGGVDEAFGPGARFPSGNDWDISLRALLRGWHVYDTANVAVIHHGFRTFAEGRLHSRRDWIAIGALCAKPIRAGYFGVIPLTLRLFSREALWPPIHDVLRGRRPIGLSRIVGFARGFVEGLCTPVERKTLLFRPVG
jgi:GT2 family glycosyltransferase